MKIILSGCLFVFILLLSGCYGSVSSGLLPDSVQGEGPMTVHEISIPDYSEVEINGGVELIYSAEPRKFIEIEIQENLLEYVIVSSEDEQLEITFTKSFILEPGYTPKVYLYSSDLRALTIHGAVSMEEADTIETESFEMVISGAGSANLDLDVDSLFIRLSGAGDLNLAGRADTAEVRISGAGSMDAANLQTQEATVRISGAGDGVISCSDYLDARISGVGTLEYLGDPELSEDTSGSGTVRRIG